MFHWCMEEQVALLALLGMVPFVGPWLRVKLSRWRKPHCCKEEHDAEVQR